MKIPCNLMENLVSYIMVICNVTKSANTVCTKCGCVYARQSLPKKEMKRKDAYYAG